MERLLAAGASPESFCHYGRNALQCTANADSLDMDVLSWLTKSYTQRKEKERYLNAPDKSNDRRATHFVAGSPNQSLEGAIALTDAGSDWTLKDRRGNTPFEWAAKHGHWITASFLARLYWDIADGNMRTDFDFDFSVCRWQQVNVQNVSRKFTDWESGTTY